MRSRTQKADDITLANEHMWLVRSIAARIVSTVPSSIEMDDLLQAGMVGLLQAAQRHDPAVTAFETFARFRIRGAMLDLLRRSVPVSRGCFRWRRAIASASAKIEQKTGRPARPRAIAASLGLPLQRYYELSQGIAAMQEVRLDDCPECDAWIDRGSAVTESPDESLAREQRAEVLSRAVPLLPARERLVIELSYYQGVRLQEIGRRLGLSESRVAQIRASAVARLKIRCQRLSARCLEHPASSPRPVAEPSRGKRVN